MLTSGELRHAYRVAVNVWLDDNKAVGDDAHDAGLRAVEAAVRADQIEKDAAIADAIDRQAEIDLGIEYDGHASEVAAAIRAQLTEGPNNK